MHNPWTLTKVQGLLKEMVVPSGGGQKGKNWDNCNIIINKIYFKKGNQPFSLMIYVLGISFGKQYISLCSQNYSLPIFSFKVLIFTSMFLTCLWNEVKISSTFFFIWTAIVAATYILWLIFFQWLLMIPRTHVFFTPLSFLSYFIGLFSFSLDKYHIFLKLI